MGGGTTLTYEQEFQLINGLRQHPTAITLLAQHNNILCGMVVAFQNFSTFTTHPMINIHDIIVLPKYRGKGIGKLLLNTLIDKAVQLNCSRITLEVRHDNINAQQLYKKLGFKDPIPPMYFWRKELDIGE
jgi:ribosomal protein S18 acetylase RimI-like enzyme